MELTAEIKESRGELQREMREPTLFYNQKHIEARKRSIREKIKRLSELDVDLNNEINAISENSKDYEKYLERYKNCLLYTSPSPRDKRQSRMPSSA